MDKKKYTLYLWKEEHLRRIVSKERTLNDAIDECFAALITRYCDIAEIWLNGKMQKRFLEPIFNEDFLFIGSIDAGD